MIVVIVKKCTIILVSFYIYKIYILIYIYIHTYFVVGLLFLTLTTYRTTLGSFKEAH